MCEYCDDIIEREFEHFKKALDNGKIEGNRAYNFISTDDYEDNYSHNEINRMQKVFSLIAKKYLEDNYEGKYIVYIDWCVHIVTKEFYQKIKE